MSSLIVEICVIDEILPIEGADRIVSAKIKGWYSIIGKDQFKVGDTCIFLPPDSLIPDAMIEKHNLTYLKNGNRVRPLKLKKFVSQGLVLPNDENLPVGTDVRERYNIGKWEPIVNEPRIKGKQKGKKLRNLNPSFHKYTDLENVRHFNDVFKEGEKVVFTEKIHGTNFRCGRLKRNIRENFFLSLWDRFMIYLYGEYEFVYGTHNVQLQSVNQKNFYDGNIYYDAVKKYDLEKYCPEDTIIYGEVYGTKVQDLEYGLKNETDLVVFDVKVNDRYLSYPELVGFACAHKLQLVPELYVGEYSENTLKTYTKGESVLAALNGVVQIREGVVVKPFIEDIHPKLGRKILKSISEDYLTRNGNQTENH